MRGLTRLSLVAAGALLPCMLSAQGLVVQSNSDIRLMGALGAVANFAARLGGGSMHDVSSTMSISGHKMRTESANSAMIIDADAGRFTTIDQKQKTYTTMTFDEMAAAMQQAQQAMKDNQQKAKAEAASDPKAAKGDMNVKYSVKVDRPGQHDKIAGYDAERVFLTISLEGEAKPEGDTAQQVGTMVFLLDQWISKDAPQAAAMREFQRAYAQKAGKAFQAQAAGLQAVFASDPRIKDGFAAAAKELAKVQGIPLRSVTYVTVVPPNQAFDRNLALGDASAAAAADAAKKDDQPKGGGFRGLMGALKSAAENASKQSDDKSKSDAPPKQSTLMSVSEEVKSITSGSVPASVFEPPAGYREIKARMPSGN